MRGPNAKPSAKKSASSRQSPSRGNVGLGRGVFCQNKAVIEMAIQLEGDILHALGGLLPQPPQRPNTPPHGWAGRVNRHREGIAAKPARPP